MTISRSEATPVRDRAERRAAACLAYSIMRATAAGGCFQIEGPANCAHGDCPCVRQCEADVDKVIAAFEDGAFDMIAHLARQREFSERAFGPGPRTKGVIDHIRKELAEIE